MGKLAFPFLSSRSLEEKLDVFLRRTLRQTNRPGCRAVERFSRYYFGRIVTGLDGSNGYALTGPGSFAVVVQTDISDPGREIKVACPSPAYLDTHWVDVQQFRPATAQEMAKLFDTTNDTAPEIPTGTPVKFTEALDLPAPMGTVHVAEGDMGVVDHDYFCPSADTRQEYGSEVRFSRKQITLVDGRELSYRQLLGAAKSQRLTPVIHADTLTDHLVRTTAIRPELPDPHALDRVVLDSRMKQRLLLGVRAATPEHRDILIRQWNLGSLPGSRGFVALLYGEPGTGKTTLVHALAKHEGCPILRLKGTELGSDPAEFTERVNSAMRRCERLNAFLLIEEADQILLCRTAHMHLLQLSRISEMLQMLETYSGVLLLTSNRPFLLDRAVQSRLNLVIEMPPMRADIREAIFLKSLPKDIPVKGALPLEAVCNLNLDGRAVKMTVVNAAARAAGSGLDHVPANFFLDEAQALVTGLQNLAADASCRKMFEEGEEG